VTSKLVAGGLVCTTNQFGITTILIGSSQYAFGVDGVAADIYAALRIAALLPHAAPGYGMMEHT